MRDAPLFFLRHGETYFNAEGRIQGQLDTPLSPIGRDQAAEAGRALESLFMGAGLDLPATPWCVSPLSRATDTATIARDAAGLPGAGFVTDARLMELNFGVWQNMTWPEIRGREPGAVSARQSDVWNFTPPGGESYAALTTRVAAWLEERNGTTVVVAHGGVARALMVLIGGVAPAEACKAPVYQGRVLAFSSGKGSWA
ncbi:MAG: histidine phosphatase family protein [Hyphomicrobiales bacterium]|nr:histidine phosphatase family protein [Hyphomicrobiales bacterium]